MPPRPSRKAGSGTVDDFLAALDHPLLDDIHELRRLILGVSPSIGEEIKWNGPSFHTSEHFATMRLHGKPPLQLILHLGVKKQIMPAGAISDPGKLLKWLAPDRACINFETAGSVAAKRQQLRTIVRQWMAHVPG